MEDSNTLVDSEPNDGHYQVPCENQENNDVNDGENEKEDVDGVSNILIRKKRKLTSSVWGHFEMLPLGDDGKLRCKCKKCGTSYQCDSKNGTGNLKRHIQNCKKRDSRNIGQLILQTNSSSSLSISDSKFDHQEFRDLFTACIIMHDLPFQCVEWVGLKALLLYLRRDLQLVSRNTARSDCKKMYVREKGQIKALLSKTTSRVCLTSDLWTSINTDGFICLTVHFIDNNWRLQKKIINFGFMPPPHDGLALFEVLQKFLIEWGIDQKIFSITLDNASANTVSVDFLRSHLNFRGGLLCNGEFLHIRCCAHIVNLIVQEGLKEIDYSIFKVRESIKYVKGSQVRKQRFLECVKQCFLDANKGLRQDVPTRWNSTFIMLDSAIYYKSAFMHLQLCDSNYKACPSDVEWEKMSNICSFLAPFYEITCVFSGSKYPTANLYFPSVSSAYATLKHESLTGVDYIKKMAVNMLTKFHKYWSDFCIILAIAVILDPRYKLNFIEWCYSQLYGGDYVSEIFKVKEKLFTLFENYTRANLAPSSSCTSSVSQAGQTDNARVFTPTIIRSQFLQGFDSFSDVSTSKKSQLELYLEEARIDRKQELDILHYWRGNQYRFPEVSAMARDVLCIPISTVASESAFSNSGRVLDQYRSALKHDIVEALICSKDWLYGDQDIMDSELQEVTEDVMKINMVQDDGDNSVNTQR